MTTVVCVAELGYRDLASALRAAIMRGDYPPGETLPRQRDLAEQWGVNIHTVRKAVTTLTAEGLVTPVRRKGTVVRARPPMVRLGAERYAKSKWKTGLVAFAADREASGQPWQRKDQTNRVELSVADEEIAEALRVEVGAPVIERARVVRREGQPTHTLTSYYRESDVEQTPITDPAPGNASPGGGFAVLASLGLEPHHMTETVHARMPTPDEAAELEMPAGEPVMILRRTVTTVDGRPVEFARGVHRASMFSWTYSFDLPD